jgi:dihydroxyacid dehydratase/phosphogluconate dehydratase
MFGLGLDDEDLRRAIVGVAAAWNGSSAPRDAPQLLAPVIERGVWAGGATPRKFAVTDEGWPATGIMPRSSLITRELVADSTELTIRGHSYDGLAAVAAAEHSIAGMMMVACRLNVPAVVLPLVATELGSDESSYAMAAVAEELGLAPSGSVAAGVDLDMAHAAGLLLTERLEMRQTPRSLVDAEAIHRAAQALGEHAAPPELVIHLIAIAHESGVDVTIEALCESMASAAANRSSGSPLWLTGSLAPDGCLATLGGTYDRIDATAQVFDSDLQAGAWIARNGVLPGTAMIIRGVGPRGGPGMPSLTSLATALANVSLPPDALIITDGRAPSIPGLTRVSMVGPEAADGGPLAELRDGQQITLALGERRADVSRGPVRPTPPFHLQSPRGAAAAKYAHLVGSARLGAVTHPGAAGERLRYADV